MQTSIVVPILLLQVCFEMAHWGFASFSEDFYISCFHLLRSSDMFKKPKTWVLTEIRFDHRAKLFKFSWKFSIIHHPGKIALYRFYAADASLLSA